jgi:ATP-binding cassette subfamily F protein uup
MSIPRPASGISGGPRKLSYKERREFEELEKRIELSEARKAELERLLASSSSDFVAIEAAYTELQSLNRELESDVDRWAALAELA